MMWKGLLSWNISIPLLQWLEVLFTVNHLLVTIKSSFNVFIYFGACMARRSPKRGESFRMEGKKGYGLINIARLERKAR